MPTHSTPRFSAGRFSCRYIRLGQLMQRGFTLIELMIVVAIIGILAAIALPMYQSYIMTTQISRVMSEAGGQKEAVDNCFNNGTITTGPGGCEGTASGSSLMADGGNLFEGGAPPAGTGTPELAFGPNATATLTATFGNAATMVAHGSTLVWSRNSSGTWTCSTNVPAGRRPTGCQ